METILTDQEARQKNTYLIEELHTSLNDNQKDITRLRNKLTTTFWTIIVLSGIIFLIGMVLLSIPVISAFERDMNIFKSLIAGGFGIADLVGLVLYGPIEKIHKLMGDMSQLILALNCNQTQTSLRLIEMDVDNRRSIGIAADKICSATERNIETIQKYFEENLEQTKPSKPVSNN